MYTFSFQCLIEVFLTLYNTKIIDKRGSCPHTFKNRPLKNHAFSSTQSPIPHSLTLPTLPSTELDSQPHLFSCPLLLPLRTSLNVPSSISLAQKNNSHSVSLALQYLRLTLFYSSIYNQTVQHVHIMSHSPATIYISPTPTQPSNLPISHFGIC